MSEPTTPIRLVEHLVDEAMPPRCELCGDGRGGRCDGKTVAVRWEHGFADFVCSEHADSAATRGAVVLYARRHDGESGEGGRHA